MFLSPELVLIFGSSGYSSAAYVIPPVAASVFFIFLYNILAVPQFYFEKTQFLMISSILAAGINIILNYFFIREFGYIAAGYTTLICYILYSIGHCIVSQKILYSYIPGHNLYNYKTIVLLSAIMIFIGVFCNFLFSYTLLRYFILLLLCIIIVFKRRELINKIGLLKKKDKHI